MHSASGIRASYHCGLGLCSRLALTACGKQDIRYVCRCRDAQHSRTAEIAALEARADRIKDANDIKRLQRAYGFYLDKAEWDQMADLFAADASVEYANEGVYVGQDRIREYLKRLGGGHNGLVEGQMNNHMMLQPVVNVAADGNSAQGRWRALMQIGQYQKSASWGEGTYENEYVKDNGVWKIKKLHWYVGFVAPYKGGWAKVKPLDRFVGELTQVFKPDQPPTVDYKPYPAAFVPPYHYENPGTSASITAPVPKDASLAAWNTEVARLEAHDAVENLQAIYGYYFDKNQWDEVANLFTNDATYEIGQRGVYKGKARIRQALDLIGPAGAQPGLLNNELQLQPIISPCRRTAGPPRLAGAHWR